MPIRSSALWMLACLALTAQERPAGQGVDYSFEKEAALGGRLARDFKQRATTLNSTIFDKYIERLGSELRARLSGHRVNYTFALIAADPAGGSNRTREPVSFPGGYIFVPAGLISISGQEAEFAGMLAHTMAHIAERHGIRQAKRSEPANLAGPLIYMGGWGGIGGSELMVPVGLRRTLQDLELQADHLAVRIVAGAGYDPGALFRYIGRVQTDDADHAIVYSSLPARELRLAAIDKAIAELPVRPYPSNSSEEFVRMQAEVNSLVADRLPRPPSLRNPR